MSTYWRIRRKGVASWTPIHVVNFDWADRIEAAMFPVMERADGLVVSHGRRSGLSAQMRVLVRSAAEDAALTAILKAQTMLVLESSLGHSWDVALVSDIERKQNLSRSSESSTYPVKHEYFMQFRVAQVTPREDPLSPGVFDNALFDQQVFA